MMVRNSTAHGLMALLFASALLAACGDSPPEGAVLQKTPPSAAGEGAGGVAEVSVKPLAQLVQPLRREAPAQVVARNETRLSAELSARVVEINAQVGQSVKPGQVLLQLDRQDVVLALARAEAALTQARARLALVKAQLARAEELRESKFASADALEQRRAEVLVAESDVLAATAARDTARHAVEKTSIKAPFAGVIKQRQAQLGELAAPGAPLLVLVESAAAEVSAQVPAAEADGLRQAGKARFIGPLGEAELRVARVARVVARDSRTVEVRLSGPGDALLPGAEGTVHWVDPAPSLPADWLVKRDEGYGVFVVLEGRARFVPIPAAREGRAASVRNVAQLQAATPIVTQGRHALRDGQSVKLVSKK